jgi:hypothetical protein
MNKEQEQEPATVVGEEENEAVDESEENEEENHDIKVENAIEQIQAVKETYSLTSLKKKYGIQEGSNIKTWEPFQSRLIDIFDQMSVASDEVCCFILKSHTNFIESL